MQPQAFNASKDHLEKEKRMDTCGFKWKAALFGAAALAVLSGPARTASAAICGDLNGDGNRTIADAVRLQRALFTPNPADCGGAGSAACGNVNPAIPGLGVDDSVVLQASLNNKPTLFALCTGTGPTPCQANAGSGPGGESWTTRTTVSGNITTNQEWIAGCRVDVDGLTFVQPGVTVTIDPGALVVGKNPPTPGNGGPTNVSALIFLRGSKINAPGTAANPILMTSSTHVDNNNGGIGDWGGLTVNGAAPVNCPGGECLAEGLVGVPFGGTDPHDSSGQVEFLRVEFSGKELTPDNELNIITMNGLGDGTIWDHTQANVGFDDCHEWFGGTVNSKFLVSSACGDDLHDTQLGTTGKYQYYLGVYYNPFMQNAGNHGFEWDNNENGFDLLPRNTPKVCNVTLVGTELQTNAIGENSERGTNLRRGTAGIIANTIWEHFRNAGILVTDNATAAQACPPTPATGLIVQHSLLFDNGNDTGGPLQVTGNWTSPCNPTTWYGSLTAISPASPTTNGTDPLTPIIYGTADPNAQTDLNQFIPAGAAGNATQPLVNSLAMDCKTIDPFFDTTTYIGAFRPGDTAGNWLTSPWISFRLH
jgi:hypothetical protein